MPGSRSHIIRVHISGAKVWSIIIIVGLDALAQKAGGMGAKVWRGVKLKVLWEEFQISSMLKAPYPHEGFGNPIVPAP